MMMTIDEIITRDEGQSFDRKSIKIDAKGLAVTIVAMANADGGEIVNVPETSQKTSQIMIDLIKEDPYITTAKMAEFIGIDRRNITRIIKKLHDQGVVRRVGPDKGGFWEIIV